MLFSRLHFIPFILFFTLLGSFVITYIISIALDHVRPLFPYISDTGTISPESTIFSEALNIGGILIYITFYIRCKQVKTFYKDPKLPRYLIVTRLNRISLWISLPIAIGATMAANFQETNALIPHMIGAFLCFVVGMIYFWLHTIISFITCPIMNTINMARFRLFIVIVGSLCCCGTGLFGVISFSTFIVKNKIADMPKWGPDDGAYELHLISSFSEWITVLFYGIYCLTFIREFKDLALHTPKMEKLNYTKAERPDYGTNSININSLDNIDRRSDEDSNGNIDKVMEIERGGSKILLV